MKHRFLTIDEITVSLLCTSIILGSEFTIEVNMTGVVRVCAYAHIRARLLYSIQAPFGDSDRNIGIVIEGSFEYKTSQCGCASQGMRRQSGLSQSYFACEITYLQNFTDRVL